MSFISTLLMVLGACGGIFSILTLSSGTRSSVEFIESISHHNLEPIVILGIASIFVFYLGLYCMVHSSDK